MAEWTSIGATGLYDEETSQSYPRNHSIAGLDNHIGDSSSNMHSTMYPSTLSDAQEMLLSILFVISAGFSIVGSSTIVIKVLCNRSKASPYDRLMLGLSSSDIIASFTYAMWPFLLPAGTSKRVWAIGNYATCAFLGFLTQLSFAALLYNGVLSYYYLLTVRFGVKRHKMARYERWMHGCAILFPLVTASIGAAFGVFHELEVGFGCWTTNYPENCEGDECTAHIWGYVFGVIPLAFAFGSLLINNIVIYRYVRISLRRNDSRGEGSPQTGSTSFGAAGAASQQHERAKQASADDVRKAQIKEVATQGFLYVGTFFFSYWSAVALRLVEHLVEDVDDSKVFPLLLVQSMCLPLQGFFNMLVYNRPNYRRIRAADPELSAWAALRRACFDTEIPRLADITRKIDQRTVEDDADFEHTSSSAACNGTGSGGVSYFPQHPEEYYNACAQHVLSSSGRSTSSPSAGFSTTLPVVEEDEEEASSLAMPQELAYAEKDDHSQENTQRDDTRTIHSIVNVEEAKEPYPEDENIAHLEGCPSLPLSRSFRIRMDGVVEDDASCSGNGEEKQPEEINNNGNTL